MKAACENEELKLSKVLMQFLCDDQLEKEPWYAKVNATSALDGIGSMFSGLGNEDESVPSNSSNNNTEQNEFCEYEYKQHEQQH